MMRSLPLALCLGLLAPALGAGPLAPVVCDDRARLEHRFLSTWGAVKQGQGLRGPDALIEVWITPRTGDWALVQAYADGTACIVAMGEHWQNVVAEADPA